MPYATKRTTFTIVDAFAIHRLSWILNMRPRSRHPLTLTKSQLAALVYFRDGQWKGVFPTVNPRTAAALLNFGLLECVHVNGKRIYRISDQGVNLLDCRSQSDLRDA
jgi:hypothetical protein